MEEDIIELDDMKLNEANMERSIHQRGWSDRQWSSRENIANHPLYQKTSLAEKIFSSCSSKMLFGLPLLIEVQKSDGTTSLDDCYYICTLCSRKLTNKLLVTHIKSLSHVHEAMKFCIPDEAMKFKDKHLTFDDVKKVNYIVNNWITENGCGRCAVSIMSQQKSAIDTVKKLTLSDYLMICDTYKVMEEENQMQKCTLVGKKRTTESLIESNSNSIIGVIDTNSQTNSQKKFNCSSDLKPNLVSTRPSQSSVLTRIKFPSPPNEESDMKTSQTGVLNRLGRCFSPNEENPSRPSQNNVLDCLDHLSPQNKDNLTRPSQASVLDRLGSLSPPNKENNTRLSQRSILNRISLPSVPITENFDRLIFIPQEEYLNIDFCQFIRNDILDPLLDFHIQWDISVIFCGNVLNGKYRAYIDKPADDKDNLGPLCLCFNGEDDDNLNLAVDQIVCMLETFIKTKTGQAVKIPIHNNKGRQNNSSLEGRRYSDSSRSSSESRRDRYDKGSSKSRRDRHDRGSSKSRRNRHDRGSSKSRRDRHDRGSSKSRIDRHGKGSSESRIDRHDRGSSKSIIDRHDRGSSKSRRDRHDRGSSKSRRDRHDRRSSKSRRDRHGKGSSESRIDRHGKGLSISRRDRHDRGSSKSRRDRHDKGSSKSTRDRHDRGSSSGSRRDRYDKGSSSGSRRDRYDKGSSSGSRRGRYDRGSSSGSRRDRYDKGSSSSGSRRDRYDKGSSSGSRRGRYDRGSSSGSRRDRYDRGSSSSGSRRDRYDRGSSLESRRDRHDRGSSSENRQQNKNSSTSEIGSDRLECAKDMLELNTKELNEFLRNPDHHPDYFVELEQFAKKYKITAALTGIDVDPTKLLQDFGEYFTVKIKNTMRGNYKNAITELIFGTQDNEIEDYQDINFTNSFDKYEIQNQTTPPYLQSIRDIQNNTMQPNVIDNSNIQENFSFHNLQSATPLLGSLSYPYSQNQQSGRMMTDIGRKSLMSQSGMMYSDVAINPSMLSNMTTNPSMQQNSMLSNMTYNPSIQQSRMLSNMTNNPYMQQSSMLSNMTSNSSMQQQSSSMLPNMNKSPSVYHNSNVDTSGATSNPNQFSVPSSGRIEQSIQNRIRKNVKPRFDQD